MQQFTACLHFVRSTTSLRVGGRAARRSCLLCRRRGGGGRLAGAGRAAVLSCLVRRCELTTGQVRSASECVRWSHCAAQHTPTQNALVRRSGRLSSHRHTRQDKTVLSVSCLAWRCELSCRILNQERMMTPSRSPAFNARIHLAVHLIGCKTGSTTGCTV